MFISWQRGDSAERSDINYLFVVSRMLEIPRVELPFFSLLSEGQLEVTAVTQMVSEQNVRVFMAQIVTVSERRQILALIWQKK